MKADENPKMIRGTKAEIEKQMKELALKRDKIVAKALQKLKKS